MKCNKEVGSFVHTVWTCVHIQDFWVEVALKLDLVFNKELDLDPVCLLLGLPHLQLKGSQCPKQWNVLTYAAH